MVQKLGQAGDLQCAVIGAPPVLSGETRREGIDNAADAIAELNHRFKKRLTLDNPRFVQRYLESELHFLVFFSIGEIDEKFAASFERAHIVGGSEESVQNGNISPKSFFKHRYGDGTEINAPDGRPNGNNEAVLVDIVKSVEGPKVISIPTFVWFERANRIDSVLPHALYFSNKAGFKLFGATRDGEACIVPVAFKPPGADQVQLLSEVIERTSEVMEDVTGDSRDIGGDGGDALDVINQLSRLRIALSSDFVGFGIEKDAECRLKVSDVFFGPFNF